MLVGCADRNGPTSRPATAGDRQDEALRDPFGYGPKDNKVGQDTPDVTGGPGGFNRKAFDRDVDRVFNP
jgi:hypothetical protein